MSIAHLSRRGGRWPRSSGPRRPRAPPARRRASPRRSGLDGRERVEQQRRDRRHRRGRLAVVRVRVPLAEPHRAVGAVRLVPQLGDDRGDQPVRLAVRAAAMTNGSRAAAAPASASRQREASSARRAPRPGRRRPEHPRQRIDRRLDLAPQRVAAEAHRIVDREAVSAAVAAISRRASASSGISDVLSATATTFDGATVPATGSWMRDERRQRPRSGTGARAGGRSRGRRAPACGPSPSRGAWSRGSARASRCCTPGGPATPAPRR